MRAPLCSDSADLCPEDQGLIGSDSENTCKFQAIERSFEKSQYNKASVFGICLDSLMGTSPRVTTPQIPFILSRLCRYIEEYGLHCKHLFLETEEKNLVESLKIEFMKSGDAPLEKIGNVASAANLLIIFFEDLPEPLIPVSRQHDFIHAMENLSLNSTDCVSHLKQSVEKLPDSTYHVLKYLSRFLFRVASYKECNGFSCDNLGLIFGPVIFRLPATDSLKFASVRSVMSYFVQDYCTIFEDDTKSISFEDSGKQKPCNMIPDAKIRRQLPCPASVMPVMSLLPLSVVIPSLDSDQVDNNNVKENVPVLLIEGQTLVKGKEEKSMVKDNTVTRKRKERRLSGEDFQQRSSSEERPSPASLVSSDKIELMRRCCSHEEMMEDTKISDIDISSKIVENVRDLCSESLQLVINEKNHSPHPPNAKRRELESNIHCEDLKYTLHPWRNSSMPQFCDSVNLSNEKPASSEPEQECQYESKQNSIVELRVTLDYDSSDSFSDKDLMSSNNDEFLESQKAKIPRSASCPVPKTEEDSSESESSSLSLSWSMLFEPEDSEPVRSEHRYSWPLTKDAQDEDAMLSPSVQSLRKSNYYEAPLSPSAYRSYLSYRSSHLDPNVPPSPPVEQEDFAKNLVESNTVSDAIKQLTKKIHGIKKRIKRFDEKFEMEFGYKPSHAEKANSPDAKKLMSDLYKARKELKALKEESHLEHVSSATTWHPSRCSHILGDSTNHILKDIAKEKVKPSVEDSFGITMRNLSDDRKISNRPESVDDMTKQQVKDEKMAIQRELLHFESIHGKPSTKNERKTFRPLYDRYRCVKRLLVRSGSFPGAVNKSKDLCSELQPILEHETMDFTSPHRTDDSQDSESAMQEISEVKEQKNDDSKDDCKEDEQKGTCSSHFLAVKYDNSNIHELPLSEMVFQLQQVKSEKRHLRKILREFESEFFRLNGRKVQKEDKAPVDTLYGEYKHVKARLKLLDALISKHDQHQLM